MIFYIEYFHEIITSNLITQSYIFQIIHGLIVSPDYPTQIPLLVYPSFWNHKLNILYQMLHTITYTHKKNDEIKNIKHKVPFPCANITSQTDVAMWDIPIEIMAQKSMP